jgi:DNA-binding beta-propeller fold protein YncE
MTVEKHCKARRSRVLTFAGLAALSAAVATSAAPKQTVLRFSSPVSGLAIERGSLWVSIAGDSLMLRLDARTGRRLARIDVHRADARAFGGGSLAAAGNKIWIAAPVHVVGDPSTGDASGWIGRIDRRTLRLKLVQVHGDRPSQVAVGRSGVWVSGLRTLRRVDLVTGKVTRSVRFRHYLGAVAVTRGAVWVAWSNTGRVLQVDPRTLKLRASIAVGYSSAGSSLAVDGDRVWAATDRGLVAIDSNTAKITSRIPLPGAGPVAFDGSQLWALADGGVYSIRGRSATKRLLLGSRVFGLLVAVGRDVWLSDEGTNSLRRIVTPADP